MSLANASANPLANITWDDKTCSYYLSKNCARVAKVTKKIREQNPGKPSYWWRDVKAIPWTELIALLKATGPEPFNKSTDGQIVDWVNQNRANWNASLAESQLACITEFCSDLRWEGSTDMAGIGVLTSYIVQTSIASLFILAFVAFYCYDRRLPQRVSVELFASKPVWTALNASVGVFWDSALLVALVTCIASLTVTAIDWSPYTGFMASLSSMIAFWTTVSTWPLYGPTCTQPIIRKVGLTLTSGLALWQLCDFDLALRPLDGEPLTTDEPVFKECVLPNSQSSDSSLLLITCVWGLSVSGIPAAILILWASPVRSHLRRYRYGCTSWIKPCFGGGSLRWLGTMARRLWLGMRVFLWTIAFLALWVSMVSFVMFRSTAGGSKEVEWGFGQIMALATWIPTVIDFLAVWNGHFSWIQGRLPRADLGRASINSNEELAAVKDPSANEAKDSAIALHTV